VNYYGVDLGLRKPAIVSASEVFGARGIYAFGPRFL